MTGIEGLKMLEKILTERVSKIEEKEGEAFKTVVLETDNDYYLYEFGIYNGLYGALLGVQLMLSECEENKNVRETSGKNQ